MKVFFNCLRFINLSERITSWPLANKCNLSERVIESEGEIQLLFRQKRHDRARPRLGALSGSPRWWQGPQCLSHPLLWTQTGTSCGMPIPSVGAALPTAPPSQRQGLSSSSISAPALDSGMLVTLSLKWRLCHSYTPRNSVLVSEKPHVGSFSP